METYEQRPAELRALGARARDQVIERYPPRRQRDELIEFFERL
jgi:hypothetical protein